VAVSVFKTWSTGEVLTASDLNSSFTQITSNGQDVGFPRTEAADFDGFDLTLDSDGDSTLDCNTDDIAVFTLRGVELVKLDGATDGTTVNGFTLYCSAAGNDIQIQAQGSDTDIDIDIVPKGAGTVLLDGTAIGTVIGVDTGTAAGNVPLNSDILGEHTVWVPASAMTPETTSGCAPITQVEGTAGRPELLSLDFSGTAATQEYAQFSLAFPKGWDEGTVTFIPFYVVSAAVSTTVRWNLAGVALSNDDALDTAFGTAVNSDDTYTGTSGDVAVGPESSAMTIAGTPAEGDLCYFRVGRDPDNDTTSQDARLVGIKVLYQRNALNDD